MLAGCGSVHYRLYVNIMTMYIYSCISPMDIIFILAAEKATKLRILALFSYLSYSNCV